MRPEKGGRMGAAGTAPFLRMASMKGKEALAPRRQRGSQQLGAHAAVGRSARAQRKLWRMVEIWVASPVLRGRTVGTGAGPMPTGVRWDGAKRWADARTQLRTGERDWP